jgi:O-antigen/teichoic acid export membrane protein
MKKYISYFERSEKQARPKECHGIKSVTAYLYTLALSQTARSTYLTTFGAGINAFFGFIFTIVVARSILPSDFGLFSVVLNLLVILTVFCDIGLSSSVIRFLPQAIREGKKEKSKKIIKISFLTALLISGFLALLLFIFSSPLAMYLFTRKELVIPLAVVSAALVGLTLTYLFIAILQGQQRFLFGVITDSMVMFVKVAATIILLLLGKLTLISVLVILSLTSLFGILVGFLFVGPEFLFAKTDFPLLKTLFSFGIWVALARISNAISGKIDTLMLVRYVETAQVGFYAAAQKMTFVFPVMVTGITAVLQPKFASLKTPSEAKSFTLKSILLISLLFIPVVVLFIIAPWITVWIYGQVYEPAIHIFRWLLLSSTFFVATTVPMIVILYYLGKSRFFAVISILQVILIFSANLVLIPRLGVIGPAISLALAYLIVFILSSAFVFKNFRR